MTKEESIRWINHAIAFYESLSKKQKELAKDLGIEESRLSELKNPHKPLKVSPNQIRLITKLCGSPKRDPGRFEYAELYDSLDAFFNQYIAVTLNRFHRDIYESLTRETILGGILEKCSFEMEDREQQVEAINQLVRSTEFAEICKDADFNRKVNNSSKDNFSLCTQPYGFTINDEETSHRLRQLWSLVEVLPEFKLGKRCKNGLDLIVPDTPLVLTGNRIAAFMSNNHPLPPPANKLIKDELNTLVNGDFSTAKHIPELDDWETIRVELYLSEAMNYHILIHMSDSVLHPSNHLHEYPCSDDFEWCNYDAAVGKKDRIAVIQNVNTLDLFREIEELRKWQGLEEDNLYELKKNIAKAGGHIPGALVLT